MNRSRAAAVVLILLGLAAGVWTLLRAPSGSSGGESADVLHPPQAAVPGAVDLADPTARVRGPTALDGDVAADAPLVSETAKARPDEPTRILRGHVAMADGTALPAGLAVYATIRQPPPRLRTMRGMINDSDRDDTFGNLQAGMAVVGGHRHWIEGELRDATRTEVAADGSFTMEKAPQRDLWLTVDDAQLFPDPAVRVGPRVETAELLLVHGASVVGRVTDGTGAGVANAKVSIGTTFDPFAVFDTTTRMASVDTEADADGRYVARQAPTGLRLLAFASKDGVNLQSVKADLAALQPGEKRTLDMLLPPGHVVSGRVVRADGAPLASASVKLMRLNLGLTDMASIGMSGSDVMRKETTDEKGLFRFAGVTDGSWQAQLAESDYRPVTSEALKLAPGIEAPEVELRAEQGLTISGRVVDLDGQPIADAMVLGSKPPSFASMQANFDRQRREPRATDAEGHFLLSGFDAGTQRLRVTAEGFVNGKQDVQAGAQDVVVQLERLTTLAGIVLSKADGDPVTDFRVNLVPSGGLFDFTNMEGTEDRMANMRPASSFQDREDGTFQVSGVLPGDYDLTVSAQGFGTTVLKDLQIERGGRRGLIVLLPPECVVSGTIASSRDGRPVQGATVSTTKHGMLSAMSENLLGNSSEATSDAQGSFHLKGLSSERPLTLSVHHDTHRELTLPEMQLQPGEQRDLGRLVLSTGAAVYGRVLDGNDRPVPGVTVMVADNVGSTIRRKASDETGHYRVEGLPAGSYNVMRMDFYMSLGSDSPTDFMKDMVMRPVTLAENEEREVDLHVKATGGTKLGGHVTAAGGPVAGAMLSLLPEKGGASGLSFASTDKNGEYEFASVQPGEQVLYVTVIEGNPAGASAQSSSPVSERITISGAAEQRHDLSLPGGVLSGTVETEADGSVVPGVRVLLQRQDSGRPDFGLVAAMGGRVGETYSDAQGGFRFRYLPAGTYALVVGGQNVIGMGAKGWAQKRVDGLEVHDNASGFTVRVKVRPAGSIEGIVRGSGGEVLPGVGVWVADPNGNWLSTFSEVATDPGGAYSVASLQEGSWTLAFRDGTHALKLVSGVLVHEGATTKQDVTLQPGVALQLVTGGVNPNSLQIQLSGPEGPVPTGLVSVGELMTLTDLGSAMNLGTFLPGTYQLRVLSGGDTLLNTTVTLVGGSQAKLVALSQ